MDGEIKFRRCFRITNLKKNNRTTNFIYVFLEGIFSASIQDRDGWNKKMVEKNMYN